MEKLTKCTVCNADVAKGAKSCPACGAKIKKPFYKKWWVWALAVVVVIAIASSSGGSGDVTVQNEQGQTEKTQTEKVVNIGDVITTEDFEICIKSVETRTKVGSQYLNTAPSEGGIYVVVNWEYKNITDKPISSFSCPNIKISDSNGVKYDSDLSATSYYAMEVDLDAKTLSDLNPSIKVVDADVFEIFEEAYNEGGFVVSVDADKDFDVAIN